MEAQLRWAIALVAMVMLAPCLQAHDYWLEADRTRLANQEMAVVRLMFGKNFAEGQEKPLQVGRTADFRDYGQSRQFGNLLLHRANNSVPACMFKLRQEGTVLVTMERTASEIRFGRAKYLEYAAREGAVIDEKELSASKKTVCETYTRYLKTLLQVGGDVNQTASKLVGQNYEIVPKENPYLGGLISLKFKVLFEGHPVSAVKVTAIHKLDGKLTSSTAITDDKGCCEFPIEQTGSWLIRSVKIVPDAPAEGMQANYHSYWASLTFAY
ncbi:MAG: DUF4198 domain-containing protein [Chthoniobacterales bacterium]